MILSEDLFDDVVVVEVPDASIELPVIEDKPLEGPMPGEDFGLADMLLDGIKDEAEAIQKYNVILSNLGLHEDMKEIINDILVEENKHMGQLQELLKIISPNAEEIDNGEVEAEHQIMHEAIDTSSEHPNLDRVINELNSSEDGEKSLFNFKVEFLKDDGYIGFRIYDENENFSIGYEDDILSNIYYDFGIEFDSDTIESPLDKIEKAIQKDYNDPEFYLDWENNIVMIGWVKDKN